MFHFSSGPRCYQHLGLLLLLTQFFLFVFGLPPFQGGIWLQTEPILLCLFILASLTCLWLIAGIHKQWLGMEQPHPLWLILLAWVGWQLLATLAAPLPWQSWFGPPQQGEGAAWYISMLLTCMLAYPLWQVASYRRVILGAACCALLLECALHLFNPLEIDKWKPGRWASYLAFPMGYLWIAVMIGLNTASGVVYCVMISLGYIALYTSWNRSAILILACSMTVSTLLVILRRQRTLRRLFHPGKAWRIIAIVICFLPLVWVVYGTELASHTARKDDLSAVRILAEKSDAIGARVTLNQATLSIVQHEPEQLLIGTGWGRFSDNVFKYVLVDGVHIYRDGKYKPNWNMINGIAFHSHSQPMEALLALGLPGMLLWFAIPGFALWYLPQRYFWHVTPMLVGLVALGCLWFDIAQVIPYHALALAAIISACVGSRPTSREKLAWVVPVLAGTALVLGWTAWQQYGAIHYGSELSHAMGEAPVEDYPVAWLVDDLRRGGKRLQISAMYYGELAAQKMREGKIDAATIAWYKNFLDAAHIMAASSTPDARNTWPELWLEYKLLMELTDPAFANLRREATASLEESVLHVTKAAPLRDDLATPFLLNLEEFTHNDAVRQVDILSRILTIAPNHRGALWVLGHIFIRTKGYEEVGHDMIQHAVALRVEDIYPITDKELAAFK
jgi:hypothetical protein